MESLQKEQVVGDVIDSMPAQLLTINWPGVSAQGGNIIVTPTIMKDQPTLKYTADENSFYSLILCDPDAPSRQNPVNGEFLHWLVVNIPGNRISEGEIKAEYVGSGAPKDTGLHRYVFMIFKQKSKQTFDFPYCSSTSENFENYLKNRRKFSSKEFAKKNSLEIEAANFVQAEYDDYVPILRKQLGFYNTQN